MDRPFRKEYRLDGTPEQIWEAFLLESNIEKWLGSGSSQMSATIGHPFNWNVAGRRMDGKIIRLVRPFKKIIFEWKREQWDEGVFAEVELEMYEVNDETELEIEVKNIPKTEREEVEKDWNMIVEKLQDYFKKSHTKKKAA